MLPSKKALIIGVGSGLSLSLARLFHKNGMSISLVARNINKLDNVKKELEANVFKCDVSSSIDVENLFSKLDHINEEPDLVIYNPSSRVRGPIEELDIENTRHALNITSFGAFLVAQQSVKRMKKKGSGSIFFTGASASTKGFPNSSVFAMGKFALRGLAQSLARELHPQNIHIGHFIIDGSIASENRPYEKDDDKLCPDEIAKRYLEFYKQKRSVWSWELEMRPWLEKF
jgi:short-subunit dehydrogenase